MRTNTANTGHENAAISPRALRVRGWQIGASIATLLVAGPVTAQPVQASVSGPRLNVQMLPDFGGGEATCAVRIPDSGTILIGGSILDVDDHDIRCGATWTSRGESIDGPNPLPDLGYGSAAFASLALPHNDGFVACMAGAVTDAESHSLPAAWVGVGAEANLIVLPTPDGGRGQAHGVAAGDVNGDGRVDVVVCGFVTDGTSNTMMAAVWVGAGEGDDVFQLRLLPALAPGADSAALAITHTWDSDLGVGFHGNGYSHDVQGNRVAVQWMIGRDQALIHALVDLPNGFDSVARTETVGANETLTVGGSIRNSQGAEFPALSTRSGGEVTTDTLRLPAGASGGRVNSIIAILIGLLAGGEATTPQGSAAMIWIIQPEIPGAVRAIDLNRIASNRPQNMRLRSVNALLPFIEQENVYRLVGTASDSQGRRHGFLGGVVDTDHAGGVAAR